LSDENVLVDLLWVASTTKRMLRMYFCETRWTSAGVTARSFSKNISELRQPPPINSYCASSAVWAALVSWLM